jgi:hypothetical protein
MARRSLKYPSMTKKSVQGSIRRKKHSLISTSSGIPRNGFASTVNTC